MWTTAARFIAVGCSVAAGGTVTIAGPVIAFSALAVIAGVMAMMTDHRFAGLVAVVLVPVTAAVQRGYPVPGLRLSELLILAALLSACVAVGRGRVPRQKWNSLDHAFVAYAGATLGLGLFNFSTRGEVPSVDELAKLLGPFVFFALYRSALTLLPSAHDRRRAVLAVLAASIPVSLLAIFQQLDIGSSRALAQSLTGLEASDLSLDPALDLGERASGPFSNWLELGGYLCAVLLVAISLVLRASGSYRAKVLLYVVILLATLALLASASAGPLAATVTGAAFLGVWERRVGRVLAVAAVVATVGVVLFLPPLVERYDTQFRGSSSAVSLGGVGLPPTLTFRYEVWRYEFLPFLGDHLLTGYGPIPPESVRWFSTESLYLTLLMRGGIPLLLIFGFLMWTLLAAMLRRGGAPGDPTAQALARALVPLLIMLIPLHALSNYILNAGLAHLLWVLTGLALAGAPAAFAAASRPRRHASPIEGLAPSSG